MLLMSWEVAELVRQKTGLRLVQTPFTHARKTDGNEHFEDWLYGPYLADDDETRIFVDYVLHKGAQGPEMRLVVQDCEDDFLNANAEGAERYNLGVIS